MQQVATLHAPVGGSSAAYHQLTQRVRTPINGLAPRIKPEFRAFGAGKCIHTRLCATVRPLQLVLCLAPAVPLIAAVRLLLATALVGECTQHRTLASNSSFQLF
jgi:hypothetical protein